MLQLDVGETLRYAGLWGHPNEAAHVAALAAPGAAWLFLVERRKLPMLLVAGALLTIFYYTQSRGGFVVGCSVLVLPLFFGRDRRIYPLRLLLAAIGIWIIFEGLSQLDFVSSRFLGAGTEGNASERLNSILTGVQVILSHPFGLSISLFHSTVSSGTGGTASPHNGFIFFGAVFGWLPLLVLMAAIMTNLSVRSGNEVDVLFALISVGLILSVLVRRGPVLLSVRIHYWFDRCARVHKNKYWRIIDPSRFNVSANGRQAGQTRTSPHDFRKTALDAVVGI